MSYHTVRNFHGSLEYGIREARKNHYMGNQDDIFSSQNFHLTAYVGTSEGSQQENISKFGIVEARSNNYMRPQDDSFFTNDSFLTQKKINEKSHESSPWDSNVGKTNQPETQFGIMDARQNNYMGLQEDPLLPLR